jgi:hypothetical protein
MPNFSSMARIGGEYFRPSLRGLPEDAVLHSSAERERESRAACLSMPPELLGVSHLSRKT